MFAISSIFALITVLLCPTRTFGVLTEAEAAHVGMPFETPHIVKSFERSLLQHSSSRTTNDMLLHHELVLSFCKTRKTSCSWEEFYLLLDHLRRPFVSMYDPGIDPVGIPVKKILGKWKLQSQLKEDVDRRKKRKRESVKGSARECMELDEVPSAAEFLEYVEASQPFVVRQYKPLQPLVKQWNLKNLLRHLGHKKVVVSVSASLDFDGPEESYLWDKSIDHAEEPVIIARPAQMTMTFAQYMDILQKPNGNTTYYLEYFPIHALDEELQEELPSLDFANFLSLRYHLIWLGGGLGPDAEAGGELNSSPTKSRSGSKKKTSGSNESGKRQKKKFNVVSVREDSDNLHSWRKKAHRKTSKRTLTAGPPAARKSKKNMERKGDNVRRRKKVRKSKTGKSDRRKGKEPSKKSSGGGIKKLFDGPRTSVSRLHFDRNENLMSVLSGTKNFTLYDPSQSSWVHGDWPLRSASLQLNPKTRKFTRSMDRSATETAIHHAYSPVDINKPNHTRFPYLQHSIPMQCIVNEGDLVYVPSHWWHEVDSHPDGENLSMAVNYFYEPFYARPGYISTMPNLQLNRYYAPIHSSSRAAALRVCSDRKICFSKNTRASRSV